MKDTVVVSPHKVYGPESNDLALQLRKRGIDRVILAGMSANLCVESHLRELLEEGFEVAVVKDATAGAKVAEGDGYAAALVNFYFIANAVITTEESVGSSSVKSVFGIGGAYDNGQILVIVLFCRDAFPRTQAEHFLPLVSLFQGQTGALVTDGRIFANA